MISSKEKVKNLVPHITSKYFAFHRNIGEDWLEFPFEESEETAEEVFSPTSFLLFTDMKSRKDF